MKALIFLFIGLLIVIALLYGGLVYLNSEKEKELAEIMIIDSTVTVKKPVSKFDSLKNIVELKEQQLTKKDSKLDSLKQDFIKKEQLAKTAAKEDNEAEAEKEKSEKARSMAKTFEKMSIKQIAPILKNLDDETVMMIYLKTGNRFKKNILLAVNEKRAAQITKEFINTN